MLHRVQQDHDSKFDTFHTQNIAIKDINSHGNVNVSLQNLAFLNANAQFVSLQELNFFTAAGNWFNTAGQNIHNSEVKFGQQVNTDVKNVGAGINHDVAVVGSAFK